MTMTTKLPDRLFVVAGTYDGVLAGWDTVIDEKPEVENPLDDPSMNKSEKTLKFLFKDRSENQSDDNSYLKLKFAMPVHEGSVRSVCIASGLENNNKKKNVTHNNDVAQSFDGVTKKRKRIQDTTHSAKTQQNSTIQQTHAGNQSTLSSVTPELLLSTGYDETMAVFSLSKHVQSGELKTPSDLGTPTCSCFAPPLTAFPTHALIGMSSGKIIIYKRKDWTVQHILSGHDDRGITCLTVHPTGKLALSGGKDGKIVLWDLVKGKLAFVYKIPNPAKGVHSTVNDIIWSDDGRRYAFCTHDGKVTARDVASGKDLLDIQLPHRANQITFIGGDEGMFLAAACDDGSLPVFLIDEVDDEEEEEIKTRRAIMAIEPVLGPSPGDERFKCIRTVKGGSGFLVVTANSGGCVSIIDLENAARMIMEDDGDGLNDKDYDEEEHSQVDDEQSDEDDGRKARGMVIRDKLSDSDSDDEDKEELELAAEILESVKLGTGARITCLSVWSSSVLESDLVDTRKDNEDQTTKDIQNLTGAETANEPFTKKRNKNSSKGIMKESRNSITPDRALEDMDEESLDKARALVKQAKKHQIRMEKKKSMRSK